MKIGFIGIGNMGYAILSRLATKIEKSDIIFTDINVARAKEVAAETGATYIEGNKGLVEAADYIVLAVKPQFLNGVMEEIKPFLNKSKIVLSIVAGVTIDRIKAGLGEVRIVRSMPNTPALVGEGMTGVAYDQAEFSSEEIKIIETIYSSFGKFCKVPENLIDVVTCASGSSPAYVYMFIEALADSAVKHGMPRAAAYEFVAQTVLGSAKMVLESGIHPGELKDRVCSPGGTTIAGVAALEEYGFRNSIIKATDACYDVCKKL